MNTKCCSYCQKQQRLWKGETVGGPQNTWWCNECYLAGRPKNMGSGIFMPNFSHHGVSSPWNAPTSAVRYSDAYNPYLRSPSDWYATTDCNPSARGRDVTRSCRTCHTKIPPTELSNACAVHGSQPLCVGCKCLICEETFPAPGQPQAESEKEERKVSSKPKPRLKIRTQAHEEPRRYKPQTSTQHQDMGRFSAIKREQAREGGRRSHFV